MRQSWKAIPLLLVLCASAACAQQARPIVPGENSFYGGYLRYGTKFGIVVGSKRSGARDMLERRHITYLGEAICDRYLQTVFECMAGQKSDLYSFSEIGRHGNVYIEYENDQITGIAWEFYLLPHVDS